MKPHRHARRRGLHCGHCGLKLVWQVPKSRRVKSFREFKRIPLAIRCLDCLHVFCQRCAHRHFAPMLAAQRVIDKKLEAVALAVMKEMAVEMKAQGFYTCGAPRSRGGRR